MDEILRSAEFYPRAFGSIGTPQMRSVPKAIQCILPVWGLKFVRQFLEVGLPTLLAPGNIPALVRALPTRFIILTKLDDADFIRQHQSFRRLCEACSTEIRLIDHLITGSNYSTTITLGYTEAIRAAGSDMLDTCFFFLVSDYIVADGSFAKILDRMMRGCSGVLAGNFNIVQEEAVPWLEEQLNRSPTVLAIPPRKLLQWALNYLHPATVANTVNIPFSHNSHTNRLFWQVDGNTLIGRFYLMHMICVRPETLDFVIGSSCDYSFIPELCPNGIVEVITDSDDYLVVEMQPREHEARSLQSGPLRPRRLAKTLSTWTTARHRENVRHPVIFHAEELPDNFTQAAAEFEQFADTVRASMTRKPKPHRDHPYWLGAIAAHRDATGQQLAFEEWRRVLGLPHSTSNDGWASDWLVEKIRFALFGRPPKVRLCHPRWPDYRFVLRWLERFQSDRKIRLLLASNAPTVFTASLADSGERAVRILPSLLLQGAAETWESMAGAFDLCLIELSENEMNFGGELVNRVAPMMKHNGEVLIMVYNKRSQEIDQFGASIDYHAPSMLRPAAALVGAHYVPATRLRWWLQRTMTDLARMAHAKPIVGIPVLAVTGMFLALGSLAANAASMGRTTTHLRRGRIATSFAFRMRVDAALAKTGSTYSRGGIERRQHRRRLGLSPTSAHGSAWNWQPGQLPRVVGREAALTQTAPNLQQAITGPTSQDETTREPQYTRCVELKEQHGLTPLGLMTNQVWHDDPRRLTFVLARYKFVAKMLEGRESVAEVGCGDGFGSRIVLQAVDSVDVYDFDPIFIHDIRQRQSEAWRLKATLHDIVERPLPKQYDGIFSLDVIEHINFVDERAYLTNLCASLRESGILIIGTPSLESQQYASPLSKAGHINCKSGLEFKSLMECYFDNVFLFSMNDEVVHTGFYPMAHYLIALCCGRK